MKWRLHLQKFKTILACCLLAGVPTLGCHIHPTTELATFLGMGPFGPAGGYPLGTIVALGENGLPERVIPRDWLTQDGMVKAQSTPLAMPNMIINSKAELQQSLSAETVVGLPVEARQALNDVSGFVIHVEKATRHSLDMGPMALIDWLTQLSPNRREDACTLEKVHLVRRGRQFYYIDEVIELQNGRYEATWNRNLNISARATFEQLMRPVGQVSWATDGHATVQITSGTSVLVAYKAVPVPTEPLVRASEFASSSFGRSRWVNPCVE